MLLKTNIRFKKQRQRGKLSPVAKSRVPIWAYKVNSGGSIISTCRGLGIWLYRLWVFRAKTERWHGCTKVLARLVVRDLTYGLTLYSSSSQLSRLCWSSLYAIACPKQLPSQCKSCSPPPPSLGKLDKMPTMPSLLAFCLCGLNHKSRIIFFNKFWVE
jgi:hypothetical protein